ncbi:pyridoxal-phosphate dependent enzyme [Marispirochaeta aestuarii]|uniref:pyridoxal-phosphate dependent enzyme n=1 Tax=Marispirochaeta aestuarii TaxID=1963862 RepID=UPI002ABD3F9D|nr:pyridoxal-phosphate dependent enzyme [Marispirochaeta aestuarii]
MEETFNLLNNASSQFEAVLPEIEDLKKVAANPDENRDTRIEAFEDIIASEVGDTPLVRARNLEREVGLRQIFLKFEGGNPSGTQKDRIAFAQVLDALRRGYDTIVIATCGNYGAAMSFACSLAGIRCRVYIPEKYHTNRIEEMRKFDPEIIRVPGDYENAVEVSSTDARRLEFYDANPGGDNTDLQIRAYGSIAEEIYDELRDAPAVISIPVSNGTTLAGIYRGFMNLYRRGKTSRVPRIFAGSSHGKNPIIRAVVKNLPHCEDLNPGRIKESVTNEPLINWHSIDGEQALISIRNSGGGAGFASDKSMRDYSRLIRQTEGFHVLPASTAGLAAMIESHKKVPLGNDRYVVVLTGRKS